MKSICISNVRGRAKTRSLTAPRIECQQMCSMSLSVALCSFAVNSLNFNVNNFWSLSPRASRGGSCALTWCKGRNEQALTSGRTKAKSERTLGRPCCPRGGIRKRHSHIPTSKNHTVNSRSALNTQYWHQLGWTCCLREMSLQYDSGRPRAANLIEATEELGCEVMHRLPYSSASIHFSNVEEH